MLKTIKYFYFSLVLFFLMNDLSFAEGYLRWKLESTESDFGCISVEVVDADGDKLIFELESSVAILACNVSIEENQGVPVDFLTYDSSSNSHNKFEWGVKGFEYFNGRSIQIEVLESPNRRLIINFTFDSDDSYFILNISEKIEGQRYPIGIFSQGSSISFPHQKEK